MKNEYTFTKFKKPGTGAGWDKYVIYWAAGSANGTSIESLVDHLVTKKRVIDLLERDFIIPGRTILQGEVLRKGASVRDLENFYKIGKEKGVIVG